MPMQPRPRAETCGPLRPSVRVCIGCTPRKVANLRRGRYAHRARRRRIDKCSIITNTFQAGSTMDRLHAMRLYARIVELGSFTAAADDLALPRATVTHTIKALESRLGAQLLQRTTRRVRVTSEGQTYYQHCVRLLADVDEVETNFREASVVRSEEHTSELQSHVNLVCRLLLEKKK